MGNVVGFLADKTDKSLYRAVLARCPYLSAEQVKRLLRAGEARSDGKRVAADFTLSGGESVSVFVPESFGAPLSPSDIKIVYADENLLAADKPEKIETVNAFDYNLENLLRRIYPTARAVHRLDLNTRGLVLFALNDAAYDELLRAFKNKTLGKYYYALVAGRMEKKSDTLTAYLYKDAEKGVSRVYGTPAVGRVKIVTEYKVLEEFEAYSALEITLVTGRTHQIRAHIAHIGHPILGDGKYGSDKLNRAFGFKTQALCAYKIAFHINDGVLGYLDGKTVETECPRLRLARETW